MKQKVYIIGYDIMRDQVYVYKDENTASANCHIWTHIEAEDANEAKQMFLEHYKPQIEE